MFEASRLFAVSPSRWLQARAQSSILASGVEEWKVVPYGVDVSTFTPASRGEARRRAGVPDGGAVLVYVANLGPNNPYKDFATIRAAVGELARRRRGPLEVLVVGQQRPLERLSDDAVIRYLPYCESASRLADLYRAADLYVHAAPEESFGLTTAEALACGTPAVVAAGGGIAEVVDHGRTGLLTPVGDSGAMAEAIAGLLDDPAGRSRMGEEAARQARARFDRDRMVAELHAWCAEVAAGWRQ
jgi:glycosyltransferase involved in cell wall biosynthesis